MKETYNKFKFFVEDGNVDSLAKNEYNQTPYQFYTFLLGGLQKNTLHDSIPQYPEYADLMNILFSRKKGIENKKISLTRFFEESFMLVLLIYTYKPTEEDFAMRVNNTLVERIEQSDKKE